MFPPQQCWSRSVAAGMFPPCGAECARSMFHVSRLNGTFVFGREHPLLSCVGCATPGSDMGGSDGGGGARRVSGAGQRPASRMPPEPEGPGGLRSVLHARVTWLGGPQKRLVVAVPPWTRPARGVCCGDQCTTRLRRATLQQRSEGCNQGSKERMKCESWRGVTELQWRVVGLVDAQCGEEGGGGRR